MEVNNILAEADFEWSLLYDLLTTSDAFKMLLSFHKTHGVVVSFGDDSIQK